ncbi:hypothetical protein K1719_047079 [Acacia pycnantha]|nr:hypothetical protein K1719_047079 [Acacia pycnantha]
MRFWGIEVKPGKPYPYHADNVQGKLHVTQATLGLGSSTEKSILQCSTGRKNPVFFNWLTKYPSLWFFEAADGDELRDDYEYDSFGEDVSDTEDSSEYNTEDEYADGFIDDSDIDSYPSPVPNSGVVIEEIVDDDKPESGDNASKKSKKQVQMPNSKDDKNSLQPIVVRGDKGVPVLESEDEDGFPISASLKAEVKEEKTRERTEKANKKKVKDDDHSVTLKRKVEGADKDEHLERKKTKKKKLKEQGKGDSAKISGDSNETHDTSADGKHPEEVKEQGEGTVSNEKILGEKKKKKKKKKAKDDGVTNANQTSERGEEEIEAKASQLRTFPNGLVVEELSMGQPDGKKATAGKQVSVAYIGKLQKTGKTFDSNIGRAPFKFRLGIGQVIKGWDVGVSGMRIGDKRRITIPPSMGYGDKRVGSIPPNSWLVFEVELRDVR